MAEPSPALVRRAQAGDREALTALIQSQQTYVYSIAMSLMHNPADAAHMTQEAFIRPLRSLGTYRAETRFTTWLYRLVTNICLQGLASILLALTTWQIFGWLSAYRPVVGDVGYALELLATSPAVAYLGGLQIDLQSLGLWSVVGLAGWLVAEVGPIGRRLTRQRSP